MPRNDLSPNKKHPKNTHMRKLAGVALFLFILSTGLYQNFSPTQDMVRQGQESVGKVVVPMHLVADAQSQEQVFKGLPFCDEVEKTVIFLRLKDAVVGERVTGVIEDTNTQVSLAIDVVVGRDFTVGNCADPTFHEAGVVKLCFSSPVGPYFKANLQGDQFTLVEHGFAAPGMCEASPTISIDLAKGN
jgi:hypothetical protein